MGQFRMDQFTRHRPTSRARQFVLVAVAVCIATSGCVERKVLIRSNPPGALVYVDDHEVGITPVAISPVYYGTRTIRLVKDGCETKTVKEPMPPPWYEVPPLDFFSENAIPGTLHDERTLDFQLQPQGVVPKEELLARAEALRRGTPAGAVVGTPGFRVNPPTRQEYVVPAGAPGGMPIGAQPYYQLPPGAASPAGPGPITTPSNALAPGGSTPPPFYQPPPASPPAGMTTPGLTTPGMTTPGGVGSQPYFPLPGGR
jgi:hypothetical protein